MTTVFPTNNLPTASQPWAREVQKQLVNLIASDNSERINNTARDNQLNSSIIALGGVVSQVTTALEEIGLLESTVLVPGEPDKINGANIKVGTLSASSITTGNLNADRISGGTLNFTNITATNISANSINTGTMSANRISGGTITGVTFQTSASGARIVMSGTRQDFYGNTGALAGYINMSDYSDGVYITNGSSYMGVAAGLTSLIQGGTTLNVTSAEGVAVFGNFTANNIVFFPGIDSSTAAANMRWGTGGPGRVQYSTASSRRFKNSIVGISDEIDLDPKKLLTIPVVAFKYNEDYLSSDDSRFNKMIPGFIAEDIEQIYEIAAEKDGIGATDWNPRYVIPGMLALIQELYAKIETLEKGA